MLLAIQFNVSFSKKNTLSTYKSQSKPTNLKKNKKKKEKHFTIKKNIEGACGVWSGDETITPQGFHKPTGQHLEAQNQLI